MGEKHAMSLVDHDGAQSWCEREQICEQKKGNFVKIEWLIPFQLVGTVKVEYLQRRSVCSRKTSI